MKTAAALLTCAFLLAAGPARADLGTTISDPEPLNNSAYTDSGADTYAHVATDGVGHWVAVWASDENLDAAIGVDYDILFARSTDDGATWTDPEPLNTNAATDSGKDDRPRVATDGSGHWVAVWWSTENLGGTLGLDSDILLARSTDNGATWTDPEPLNTNAATDSWDDTYPRITTDRSGNWVTVWSSNDSLGGTIGFDVDILFAHSTDLGVTWTDPDPLNKNAATDSGSDLWPDVASDGAGNWVATWYSDEDLYGQAGTDTDILKSQSTGNGATWSIPSRLNTNAYTDSGADYQPRIASDGAGTWVVVWWSEDDLDGTIGTDVDALFARSTDTGYTWTDPAPVHTNAATDTGSDYHPAVTSDGPGNWVVVWGSSENLGGSIGTDADILAIRSTDHGTTWTAPEPLNTNAALDGWPDGYPELATDRAGNWVAVWRMTSSLGGTIGTDPDIGTARFFLCHDSDGDGFWFPDHPSCPAGSETDCEDANADIYPGAPQICDGLNNDCDDPIWPFRDDTNDWDDDGDTVTECEGDCDDTDPDRYARALEIHDGKDNQCPGDFGYGSIDEISGVSGFHVPGDKTEFSWDEQVGALAYEVARSTLPDFYPDCMVVPTSGLFWRDTQLPDPGIFFCYLVRSSYPLVGSWGQSSDSYERFVFCAP